MKKCSIEDCKKFMTAKGYCPMHYSRAFGYNKVPLLAPNQRPHHGEGWCIDKDGYRQIRIKHKYVREHRFLMEKYLKRKLKPEEVVHHKNHIKTDNRIENLEITSFSKHTKDHLKEREIPAEIKLKAIELYRSGVPATKIPALLPIGYSCAYWTIRNSGEKIRGIHNRSLRGNYGQSI